jgi:hypothetical protein
MAAAPVPESQRDVTMAPSDVSVTVFRVEDRHERNRVRFRTLATAALAVGVAAVSLAVSRGGGSGPAIWAVGQPGPAGVAAAYGYPASCLRIRISAVDSTFARADFQRLGSCTDAAAFPTALFHRFGGEWHPILYTVGYQCPVESIPAPVQRQLSLCLR